MLDLKRFNTSTCTPSALMLPHRFDRMPHACPLLIIALSMGGLTFDPARHTRASEPLNSHREGKTHTPLCRSRR